MDSMKISKSYFAKIEGKHDYCGRSMKTRPCASIEAARASGWKKAERFADLKGSEVGRYFSVTVFEKSTAGSVKRVD